VGRGERSSRGFTFIRRASINGILLDDQRSPFDALRYVTRRDFHGFLSDGLPSASDSASNGYRAWIRTMNNASKGRCVTVTPRGKKPEPHPTKSKSAPAQ
jgi:hypothetical protein